VTRVGPTTLRSDHLADTTRMPVVQHLPRRLDPAVPRGPQARARACARARSSAAPATGTPPTTRTPDQT